MSLKDLQDMENSQQPFLIRTRNAKPVAASKQRQDVKVAASPPAWPVVQIASHFAVPRAS